MLIIETRSKFKLWIVNKRFVMEGEGVRVRSCRASQYVGISEWRQSRGMSMRSLMYISPKVRSCIRLSTKTNCSWWSTIIFWIKDTVLWNDYGFSVRSVLVYFRVILFSWWYSVSVNKHSYLLLELNTRHKKKIQRRFINNANINYFCL